MMRTSRSVLPAVFKIVNDVRMSLVFIICYIFPVSGGTIKIKGCSRFAAFTPFFCVLDYDNLYIALIARIRILLLYLDGLRDRMLCGALRLAD